MGVLGEEALHFQFASLNTHVCVCVCVCLCVSVCVCVCVSVCVNEMEQEEAEITGGIVTESCPTLVTPWSVAHQAPLSMGFYRQDYWSGLSFPSPGDLPDPGIEPGSPQLPAGSLPTGLPGNSQLLDHQ